MAQVEIRINAKPYRVSCEDGQEDRLRRLAAMVDAHVKDLVGQVGQVGDTRLMVMAALLITDELVDLREAAVGHNDDELQAAREVESSAAAALDVLARRIEAIAEHLEGS